MSAVQIEPMPQDNEGARQLAETVAMYLAGDRPARRAPDPKVLNQLNIAAFDVLKGLHHG